LDGEHGKASSRSYGGFNLFASLKELSSLLESYGGHELAAGFTISKGQIPAFRERIGELARKFYTQDCPRTVLDADCAVTPELLTLSSVEELSCMEPCGNGCPKPLLVMEKLRVDRIGQVGSGRHMRLQLSRNGHSFQAIYFSANAQSASVSQGDLVDVVFTPQINEYRGIRNVQMNLQDIRPHCDAPCLYQTAGYRALQENTLDKEWAEELLPERSTLATVWRYLASNAEGIIQEEPMCLCRKIVRWTGQGMSLAQLLVCLDIFRDVGLLETENHRKYMTIRLCPGQGKADLSESVTMQRLVAAKES
jgi:single-stranded-DNA-specific exonuclease